MKAIDLKIQQQMEEASKKLANSELQAIYQDKMMQSLEQERRSCQERLRNCRSKEEVWGLMEDYEEEVRLGVLTVENNPAIPLEKKLEYTMLKNTRISIMEELIEEFSKGKAYEALPEKSEAEEEEAVGQEAAGAEKAVEPPFREQNIKYAKAKAGYEGSRRSGEKEAVSPKTGSFEAKG